MTKRLSESVNPNWPGGRMAAKKRKEAETPTAPAVTVVGPRTFVRLETPDGGLIYVGHSKGLVELNALAQSIVEGLEAAPKKSRR